jgi:hypothetical protein
MHAGLPVSVLIMTILGGGIPSKFINELHRRIKHEKPGGFLDAIMMCPTEQSKLSQDVW